MTTKQQQTERTEAIDHLRTILKPGDTVYVVLRGERDFWRNQLKRAAA